jgi:translation initiation factor 2B subunit (eIF-2B alpha/beta/delta family)
VSAGRNKLAAGLDRLRRDRTRGALDLALEAIDLAKLWMAEGQNVDDLAKQLQSMHPAIATVRNVGGLLLNHPGAIDQLEQSLRQGNERIARNLRSLIPSGAKVITLSNSSTVREALVALKPSLIFVMESLPGGEGRDMAASLEKQLGPSGGEARLILDGAACVTVPKIDCALVGIDAFDAAGAIYHKIGTLPLAQCCRQFGKPFYAAGHSLKRVEGTLGPVPEPADPGSPQLFDRTPPDLITRLVTEE